MKKFILGIVVGAILFSPIAVNAWNERQMAKPIIGADCKNLSYYTPGGDTYKYYREHPDDFECSTTIYVFDDGDNKCYLAKGSNGTGLSCLKR